MVTWDGDKVSRMYIKDTIYANNMTVSGTFTFGDAATDSLIINGIVRQGTSTTSGVALTTSSNKGYAQYTQLPSTGSAITAGTVVRGIWNRLLMAKAQTDNVSITASQGHLRVTANMAAGAHMGMHAYFEQSGTVVLTSGIHGALRAQVEGDAALTANALYGVVVDYTVRSGATVTASSGVYITNDLNAQGGMGGWGHAIQTGAGFATGIFKMAEISNIVATRGTPNSTAVCDGYVKCLIGAKTLLIPLYNAATIS